MMLVAIASMSVSCVTPKRVNYLQDMEHDSQIQLENRFEATISPYDELSIIISCSDPELAKPFNLGGNTSVQSRGASYLVDVNGNIQFPVIGTIYVAGMTRLQLQEAISARLESDGYIKDPFVQVRFSNFKIFFLGAEGGGKAITISNERCTFLEALALSGGLSNFTRRDKIAVLREVNGRMTMRYLDPRSSKVFDDPFFMLQQNDFIITELANGSLARSEMSYWTSWITTGISFITMLTTLAIFRDK